MDFRTAQVCQSFETLILEIMLDPRSKLSIKIKARKIIEVYEQMLDDKSNSLNIKNFIIQARNHLNKKNFNLKS